jgi:hypothetical protein
MHIILLSTPVHTLELKTCHACFFMDQFNFSRHYSQYMYVYIKTLDLLLFTKLSGGSVVQIILQSNAFNLAINRLRT